MSNANSTKIKISYTKLITKCLEILENVHSRRYFGWSFIQLIEKSVLLTGEDLSKISLSQWIGVYIILILLSFHFLISFLTHYRITQHLYFNLS